VSDYYAQKDKKALLEDLQAFVGHTLSADESKRINDMMKTTTYFPCSKMCTGSKLKPNDLVNASQCGRFLHCA
jgi:hypothetical protein